MQLVLANDENCLTLVAMHYYFRKIPQFNEWSNPECIHELYHSEVVGQLDCDEIDSDMKREFVFGNKFKAYESNDILCISSYLSAKTKSRFCYGESKKSDSTILGNPKRCFNFTLKTMSPEGSFAGHTLPQNKCSYLMYESLIKGPSSEEVVKKTVLFFIKTQYFETFNNEYYDQVRNDFFNSQLEQVCVMSEGTLEGLCNDLSAIKYPILSADRSKQK